MTKYPVVIKTEQYMFVQEWERGPIKIWKYAEFIMEIDSIYPCHKALTDLFQKIHIQGIT